MLKPELIKKDFLGQGPSIEIPYLKKIIGNYKINISKYSGLVSVYDRRNSKEIADLWTNKIFKKKLSKKKSFGHAYTSKIPAVIARTTYVLETIISELQLRSKSLCDVGAGEGLFLNLIKNKKKKVKLTGVEPSKFNCKLIKKNKIDCFNGTLEEFYLKSKKKFDIITLLWTLCNTSNAYDIIAKANKLCKDDGYIVIAESSRILVPFKKPIQMYLRKGNPDNHPFHFSKNSLSNLLIINKFKPVFINRYIDSDVLVIIAKKSKDINTKDLKKDNYKKVKSFFQDWYFLSKKFNKDII